MEDQLLNSCPVPLGNLLIIGGKEKKGNQQTGGQLDGDSEILKVFVELLNRKDPVIEVITSASEEGNQLFDEYNKVFQSYGASRIGHIHHLERESVLADCLTERVMRSDGFFFTGGDQLRLTSLYGGTTFLTHLKNRYINEPITIGGTSAGAMAMSTPMIYAGNEEVQQIGGEIKITTGLEFLKDVCIDTHFVHRGRFVRMAQVIATNPSCIGIGIEEDTAIIVRNGLDVEVVGSGTVIITNGFQIGYSNTQEFAQKQPICIKNLRVDILKKENKFKIEQLNPQHI